MSLERVEVEGWQYVSKSKAEGQPAPAPAVCPLMPAPRQPQQLGGAIHVAARHT